MCFLIDALPNLPSVLERWWLPLWAAASVEGFGKPVPFAKLTVNPDMLDEDVLLCIVNIGHVVFLASLVSPLLVLLIPCE